MSGEAGRTTAALLAWFDGRERDVPWRDEGDPYRVWVAEVMAQQTRIETVREYYVAFLDRFPDVDALADAGIDDVLSVWQGLGYYARARHLHAAARVVADRHGGDLPGTVEELRELPGVGAYTAGAIASHAFGRSEPAVDGNARRVLSRLFDLDPATPAALHEAARALLSAAPDRPAAVNQAIMDLGGAVCTPRAPACGDCPVRADCVARARGTVEHRPPPRDRTPVPRRRAASAAVLKEGRVLLVRRPDHGLLGGLWDLPQVALEDAKGNAPVRQALAREARAGLSIDIEVGERLCAVDHVFSHFRLRLEVFEAAWRSGRPARERRWTWADAGELGTLATPTYLREAWRALSGRLRAG